MIDFKNQILAVLRNINSTGSFAGEGAEPFVFPGMVVNDVDEISFPIPDVQVKQLISRAHKAPFGKGAETIVDAAVRSGWEINPGEIRFTNEHWNEFVQSVVAKVKIQLGIPDRQVSSSLYKVLIYEKGDFFLPHKDSEKESGMFGTLIIGLPSRHEGGELLVHFDGETRTINFSVPEQNYQIPYVAFYADCVHEVKPIRSGYRVCLVYNLILRKKQEKIQVQQLSGSVNQLATILKAIEEDEHIPRIILLGHQYTPSNFTMDSLKLNDRVRAEALLRAADASRFYAKPALVTCYQVGEFLEDFVSSSTSWSRRKRNEEEDLKGDGTMGEIFDEYLEIRHWMPGGVPSLGGLSIMDEDLISPIQLNNGEPIKKEVTEYTGNAGMDMEYWYHYGAIVLWPRKQHYNILRMLPVENMLEWIAYYNQQWHSIDPTEASLIKRLVEEDLTVPDPGQEVNADPLAEWLFNLNDEKYLSSHGEKILEDYFELISIERWINLFRKYPFFQFERLLTSAGNSGKLKDLGHLLAVLQGLSRIDQSFEIFIQSQLENLPSYLRNSELTNPNEQKFVVNILKGTIALSTMFSLPPSWYGMTSESFTSQLNRTFVNNVLTPILLKEGKRSRLGDLILKTVIGYLGASFAQKPPPPADWSRPLPSYESDYSNVWKILEPFLNSPVQRVFDYRKVQSERSKMEYAIRNVTIDLSMETIRKGSPHTLRITKTQAAYEKKLAEWNEDAELLKRLESKFG